MAKVRNKWDQVSPTEKVISNVLKVVAVVVFFTAWFTTIFILITQ
jgi:hypothetical protein